MAELNQYFLAFCSVYHRKMEKWIRYFELV